MSVTLFDRAFIEMQKETELERKATQLDAVLSWQLGDEPMPDDPAQHLIGIIQDSDAEINRLNDEAQRLQAKLHAFSLSPEFAAAYTTAQLGWLDEIESIRTLAWRYCIEARKWRVRSGNQRRALKDLERTKKIEDRAARRWNRFNRENLRELILALGLDRLATQEEALAAVANLKARAEKAPKEGT